MHNSALRRVSEFVVTSALLRNGGSPEGGVHSNSPQKKSYLNRYDPTVGGVALMAGRFSMASSQCAAIGHTNEYHRRFH